ncbi:hypothetical protein [Gracilibacillus sp. YIM 98692]|uniref:hypothetical protein n=1 Tax=Gracilibacillus sp. YIM 98692 TaxID=2663532 RepID=UPI0013D75372|nr:hypothetical protein [Gracilibacillus sp. YIM 98692]
MQKIFLAISDKIFQEQEWGSDKLKKLINSIFTESDQDRVEQEWLTDRKAVTQMMEKENDFILVMDMYYWEDVKTLPDDKGEIYYINPNEQESYALSKHIKVFRSLTSLHKWSMAKNLINPSVMDNTPKNHTQKHKNTPNPKQKVEGKQTKESNTDTKNCNTKAEEKETITDIQEKKEEEKDILKEESEKSVAPNTDQSKKDINQREATASTSPGSKDSDNSSNEANSLREEGKIDRDTVLQVTNEYRKGGLSDYIYDRNKTIGMWSPVAQNGVTTLAMNLGIYFGYHRIPTAVMECMKSHQEIQTILQRVTEVPDGWKSYLERTVEKPEYKPINWYYRGVSWYPLAKHDVTVFNETNWELGADLFFIEEAIHSIKKYDCVFLDFPSGEMESYSLSALHQVDELWVMVNGNYARMLAWKRYIEQLKKSFDLNVQLIVMKKGEKVREKELATKLDIPLLTCIPNLSEEIDNNYYQTKPLIEDRKAKRKLEQPFQDLFEQVKSNKMEQHAYSSMLTRVKDLIRSFT